MQELRASQREFINKIVHHKSEWIPLLSLPSVASRKTVSQSAKDFWKELHDIPEDEWCGVYQVSLTCPEEIVHKDIGYVGTSEFFPYRTYNLKCSTTSAKNMHHKCGRFLHYSTIKPEEVFVRLLYTSVRDAGWLEGLIHDQMRQEFNYQYGFMWEQASGGPASSMLTAFDGIARLTSIAEIEQLEAFLEDHKAKLNSFQQQTLASFFK